MSTAVYYGDNVHPLEKLYRSENFKSSLRDFIEQEDNVSCGEIYLTRIALIGRSNINLYIEVEIEGEYQNLDEREVIEWQGTGRERAAILGDYSKDDFSIAFPVLSSLLEGVMHELL